MQAPRTSSYSFPPFAHSPAPPASAMAVITAATPCLTRGEGSTTQVAAALRASACTAGALKSRGPNPVMTAATRARAALFTDASALLRAASQWDPQSVQLPCRGACSMMVLARLCTLCRGYLLEHHVQSASVGQEFSCLLSKVSHGLCEKLGPWGIADLPVRYRSAKLFFVHDCMPENMDSWRSNSLRSKLRPHVWNVPSLVIAEGPQQQYPSIAESGHAMLMQCT